MSFLHLFTQTLLLGSFAYTMNTCMSHCQCRSVESYSSSDELRSRHEGESQQLHGGDSSSTEETVDSSSRLAEDGSAARVTDIDKTPEAGTRPTTDVDAAPAIKLAKTKLNQHSTEVPTGFTVETHLVQNPEVEQVKDNTKAQDLRPITADALNKKIKEIGAPFSLGSEHFTVEFKG